MAESDVTVRIKTVDDGSGKMRQFADNVKGLNKGIEGAQKTWRNYTFAVGAATGVMVAGGVAVKKLYDTMRAGAVLETTTLRFNKLSESIGTTADAMMGQLRVATQGMISDAELMSSASQMISLRLADNAEQVVRLTTVAGVLNWDMQQVILTFANMSTMRLDALGLSVEEVTSKAKELEKTGMSAQQAFKEAVILAGEARLDVGGVSEQEKAFKKLETAIANTRNELSSLTVQLADQTGAIDFLSNLAANIELNRQLEAAYKSGAISAAQYEVALIKAAEAPGRAAEALIYLSGILEDNNLTLLHNENAWSSWAIGVQVRADEAATAVIAASTEIFRSLVGVSEGLDWMGGARPGVPSNMQLQAEHHDRQAQWMESATARYRQEDSRIDVAQMRGDYERAARAVGGFGSAVSQATEEELELAEAHNRFMSAFNSELTSKVEDGLIGADGLVNIERMNEAMMEQAKAAGLSATQLALLGVATGQYTEEQAAAALKAAVLQERIAQLAKGIVTGQMSMQDALGNLDAFRQNLDAAQPGEGGLQNTVAQIVSNIPEDDRTILFLSDTGMVDDEIMRLERTVVEIPAKIVMVGGAPVTYTGPGAPNTPPTTSNSALGINKGATKIDVNMTFNGATDKAAVKNGMDAWTRELRREGVLI